MRDRPKPPPPSFLGALGVRCGEIAACLAILGAPAPLAAQDAVLRDVRIPMRDGVTLSTDVWLPDSTGAHPVVLIRTPYGNTDATFRRYRLHRYLDEGYAVAFQATRGTGASDGEFDFYFPEGRDGYDTVEWLAAQPWADGRVAMDGGSYLGAVQWLAAREDPPHLRCIIPTAPSGDLFDELPYVGGAFHTGWALPWIAGQYGLSMADVRVPPAELMRHRPLLTVDSAAFGRPLPLYRAMLEHPTLDDWWRRIHFGAEEFRRLDIPALTVTGWFDGDQPGALWYWRGMRAHSPAADRQWLVIGPWVHAETYLGGGLSRGAFELSPQAVLDTQALRLAFLDACMAPDSTGDVGYAAPRALVYLTGANDWLELDDYPASRTEYRPLHLRAGGRLTWAEPGDEAPDGYVYDPADPVPTTPAATDHAHLEAREDVLVYSSEPLAEPLDVVGPIVARIWAASDARDTDFVVKLLDVYPDGRAVKLNWAGGVQRARYRGGYEREVLLEPGAVEAYAIELYHVGHRFLPGHRIRIHVSSSDAPYVDPNLNTGAPVATDTGGRPARQSIFHDAERPSHVLLPVLPAGTGR